MPPFARTRARLAALILSIPAAAGAATAPLSGEFETLENPGFRLEYQNCDGSLPTADRLTLPRRLSTRYKNMEVLVRVPLAEGVPQEVQLLEGNEPLLEALSYHVRRARFAVGEPACVMMRYRVTDTVVRAEEVVEFRVWVDAIIGADGRVARAEVVEELTDPVVSDVIIRQVGDWTLEPGYRDGQAVSRGTSLRVEVNLVPDGWDVYTVRTSLNRQGPRPVKTTSPRYPRHARNTLVRGSVLLEFSVSPDGEPVDPKVLRAVPHGVFEEAAMRAIKRWRYRPETVDGVPVPSVGVQDTVDFDYSHRPEIWRVVKEPRPWELD